MTTIATICARGGSTGVPRKNLRDLCGRPLIAHTIAHAFACPEIEAVYVSTDDDEIARVARDCGAIVPFRRPAEMATTTAPKLPVIAHLVDHVIASGVPVSRIVDLDPTSPLRLVADISASIALLDAQTDVVITGYQAEKNPYFNMVEVAPDGNVRLVKPPSAAVTSRQEAPEVLAMNGSVYVWHAHSLGKGLWGGRVRIHRMPRERSVDIDSEIDFRLVEILMREAGAAASRPAP